MKDRINNLFGQRTLKIIGYFLIILSICLLIKDLIDFIYLPTRNDERFELISLTKYKEDTVSRFYLWILLFLAGVGFIKRNSLGWTISQFFLIFGCGFLTLLVAFGMLKQNIITLVIVIMAITLTILWIKLFLGKKARTYFKTKQTRIPLYYLVIAILIGIFAVVEYGSFYLFE